MPCLSQAGPAIRRPFGVGGIRCRCPPVKQRAPFVRACVPDNADLSHDKGRVNADTGIRFHRQPQPAPVHGWFIYLSRRLGAFGVFIPQTIRLDNAVGADESDCCNFPFPGDVANRPD